MTEDRLSDYSKMVPRWAWYIGSITWHIKAGVSHSIGSRQCTEWAEPNNKQLRKSRPGKHCSLLAVQHIQIMDFCPSLVDILRKLGHQSGKYRFAICRHTFCMCKKWILFVICVPFCLSTPCTYNRLKKKTLLRWFNIPLLKLCAQI